MKYKNTGFTLLELLISIVLMAFLFTAIAYFISSSQKTVRHMGMQMTSLYSTEAQIELLRNIKDTLLLHNISLTNCLFTDDNSINEYAFTLTETPDITNIDALINDCSTKIDGINMHITAQKYDICSDYPCYYVSLKKGINGILEVVGHSVYSDNSLNTELETDMTEWNKKQIRDDIAS